MDNDFPVAMANPGVGFLQQYLQEKFAREQGGPLIDETLISASPSFDLSYPKIPGRDLEGVPNANDPVMREKLRQRLLKNPEGGQELPGFLKRA